MNGGRGGARGKADAGSIELPPREEWDFRGIAADECGLACCWEYARELPRFTKDPKCWIRDEDKRRGSPIYLFWEGKHLEKGWLTMTPAGADSRRRLRRCGIPSYPDFRLVASTDGFEVKGLAYPGREANYDCNSQVPSGSHNGRTIFYIFGRYPADPDGDS